MFLHAALWVSTNLTGMDYDKATGTGFMVGTSHSCMHHHLLLSHFNFTKGLPQASVAALECVRLGCELAFARNCTHHTAHNTCACLQPFMHASNFGQMLYGTAMVTGPYSTTVSTSHGPF